MKIIHGISMLCTNNELHIHGEWRNGSGQCNLPATNPLFITAGRKRFSANVMAQHFHYLFKSAGIAGASSHSMRRSFLTSLAAKGISVRVLADLAGHRNLQVTMRYLDASDDMKRNAVELV